MAAVVRRGWPALAAALGLSYLLLLVATLVAANVARGLGTLELNVFDNNGTAPRWVGLLAYAQGGLLLATAILVSFSAMLAATVEVTRSVRTGESIRAWTPFRRGLERVPAVSRGVLLLIPRLALVTAIAAVLFVLSVLVVPIGVVIGLVWLLRPSWRRPWMRWPLLAATPFGILAFASVRWALWLPFVVVDGDGARAALRASKEAVRPRWAATARPLAIVCGVAALGIAVIVTGSELGADETLTGFASVAVALMTVVGCSIAATLLHETYGGPLPPRHAPAHFGWRPGLRPSPGLAVVVIVGLIASSTWLSSQQQAAAAPGDPGSPIVNSLDDDLTPDLGVDCLTPEAPCTLRAAVAQAAATPGGTITFAGDGTVNLLGTLNVSASVAIDGIGNRVTIRNTTGGTAIIFGAVPEGGGEVPPGTYELANLTVASMTNESGVPTSNATGVRTGAGQTTVRNVTFRSHQSSEPGSALHNAATLNVINSTFVLNSAMDDPDDIGGTIASVGSLTVNNSTFFDNSAGGVVTYAFGSATVTNSVFRGSQGGFNCPSSATVSGNVSNDSTCAAFGDATRTGLSDAALKLGAFDDHGGPVDTVALQPGSAAIEASEALCPTTDARGELRPIPPAPCDAGAYQASNGTTTTVDAPVNPAKFGSPVTVNVTVQHPQAIPSGSVTLSGFPGGPATEALSGGQASFSLTDLPVAVHALTATYVPDATLEASTGQLNLTIEQQASNTVLTIDPPGGTSAAGAPITLTATVTNAGDASGAVPTGTVLFKDGANDASAPIPLSSGTAELTGVTLSGGAHSLTAVYSGSTGFQGSTSPAKSHAVQSPTDVTLTAPASSVYGATFGMSVSVTASAGGVPDAIGNVTVTATDTTTSNSFSAGFGTLSGGVASITSSVLPAGSYNLSASYAGDSDHAAGASDNEAHTVQAAATSTGLVGPSGPTIVGEAAPFTATVTPTGTSAVPTGAVAFAVDGSLAATVPLAAGSATYSPTGLTSGPHSVVATFQPDNANFVTSPSSPVSHTVTATETSTVLTAPATSVAGESVSLVAVVTPESPSTAVPTGTVTFLSNGTSVGTAPLVSGTATLPITTLAIGAHSLTASYATNGDLLGSVSAAVPHTVSPAATDVVLTSSLPAPTHGQALSLTATAGVVAPGSGAPTGTIVFKDGATVLGTVPLSGGTAVLPPISTLGAGDRALTAEYAGDGRFLPDVGALTLHVDKAVPVVAITGVSPSPSRFGSPVTMTASVISPTNSTPTGQVAFSFGGSGAVVGQAPVVNGVATFTTSDLNIVRTVVGAHYLGDGNHADAFTPVAPDSALVFHTVQQALIPLVISTETTPTAFGELIRVFADVTPVGGRIPTGPVSIRVQNFGVAPTTFFDANGHAQAEFTGVFPGDPNIIVNVGGDFWFEESLNNVYSGHHVDLGTATVALTASPAPVGSPTTLTATLGPAATAGIGRVRFLENGLEIARADVDFFNKAIVNVTFTAAGAHVITASYDGGFGFFHPVSSAPLTVNVPGRAINLNVTPSGSTYGNTGVVQTTLFTFDDTPPLPTGTITVRRDGQTLGVGFVSASAQPGLVIAAVPVSIGSLLEPGSHPIVVTYSGDAIFGAVSVASTFVVSKRTLDTIINTPIPSPASAGEPVILSGRVVVPGGGLASPTGTLRLGNSATFCDVPLVNGVLGGSCTVRFTNAFGVPEQLFARYLGDTRYNESRSGIVELPLARAVPFVELVPSFRTDEFGGRVWTDSEAVPVRWNVIGPGTATPTGRVEIWTNEGRQFSCSAAVAGTCDVRFRTATRDGWIEARFVGDNLFEAAIGRSTADVVGCFNVSVFPGSQVLTAPNCAATKFISGSRVGLAAPARAGYTLAGWSEGPDSPTLEQSPVWVFGHRFLEPRYNPVCFTLTANMRPFNLPRLAPEPAPNCDDLQAADFTIPDLDAIRAAEVQSGAMRYRAGTRVTLPSTNMSLNVPPNGLRAAIRWSGDGVGADRVVTVDRDRTVLGELDLPCRRFVVDGPPGSTFAFAPSFDTSKSDILQRNFNTGGRCVRADGSAGYITGTSLRVTMTPPAGTWFERWGAVERLAGHSAPAAVTPVGDRPTAPAATGIATVGVPDYDAAMSGFAAGVTCYELKLHIKDAPITENAPGYPGPAVTTSAPNCPTWWLQEQKIPTTPTPKFFVGSTDVTVTASDATRRGFVEEFPDSRQIYFRRWSGDVAGDGRVQTFKITKTTEATAEWYVAARCSKITVKGVPAASGEVIVNGIGDACPEFKSQFAGVPPTPQAELGTVINLAARPNGTLQTLWHVEGPLVSNQLKCREREDLIAFRYDDGYSRGKTKAEIDRILMEQGYLPGLTLARIEEEAKIMFDKGYTQAQIIGDLKTMGLLDANGAPIPDRLRANPCDSVNRDTILPAGQRALSLPVDGDVVATAWFCQAIDPSVTVIALNGTSAPATGKLLDSFGPLFQSSDKSVNCPTPGWFLPNTTAVLGSGGSPVPGYSVEGWSLDGVAKGAGPLSVPISQDGAPHALALTVRVQCRTLKVTAPFGSTITPAPDCPGAPASENRYKQGDKVTVGAGEDSDWIFQKWSTGQTFNPVLVTMSDNVDMTAQFREKTFGEQFTETVLDPAINAMGVAAKKVVGGLAYATKIFAQAVIEDVFLNGLSLLGTAIDIGFGAMGVEGKVLDGIVIGLQQPKDAFEASLAGFDCIEEWAWGRSVPTLGDLADLGTQIVTDEAGKQFQGVSINQVLPAAHELAAKIAAGDAEAIAIATVAASGGGPPALVYIVAKDIAENPDEWLRRLDDADDYALRLLEEQFGKPFTWETSAGEAWTSGGDAFLSCMAENGKKIAEQ